VPGHSRSPKAAPLPEGMQVATARQIEMTMQLAELRAVVSSTAQSVLGHPPTRAF
jgi:hypothetical protein